MKEKSDYSSRIKRLKERLLTNKFSAKFLFIFMGIASTVWFLIRVIPKPQRAGYPCMRATAPIMSGFVLYILSLGGLTLLFKRTISNIRNARYWSAVCAFGLAITLLISLNIKNIESIYASSNATNWTRGTLPDSVNTPMGESFGINPGRVVWVWNPAATNENCPNLISDAFFMSSNNNQDTINKMADDGLKKLTGKNTVVEAWDALFKNFNKKKTGTESGYTAGQKIFFKVNNGQAGWAINPSTLAETGQHSEVFNINNIAMSETSPFPVIAVIRQLVDSCGVAQSDIYVAEPMTHVYKSMYDAIHAVYPNVKILDKENKTSLGRTTSSGWHANAIKYSDQGNDMPDAISDAIMNEMYDADYMISVPALKAHARGGVTLTAKNHFGSHGNHPGYGYGSSYLHDGLINNNTNNDVIDATSRTKYGMYRVLTDLIGHEKLGGNTILYVMDGLWSGVEATDMPTKWQMVPFNNDFPNSLFLAQDPVALESVCIDFLRAEATGNANLKNRPFFPAVDDHLHQAAEKANWPADFVYDPEGDGTPMGSLGVHEHWNDATNKQYSRDLYTNGTGIDLVSIPSSLVTHSSTTANTLTFTVTGNGSPLQDAVILINGSKYRTDADGKVTISNFSAITGLNYTISNTGFDTYNGQVDISGDTQVSKDFTSGSGTPVNTNNSKNNFSVFPNPCVTETNVSFTLEASTYVDISLVSIEGKVIRSEVSRQFEAGEHNVVVNTEDLTKGVYFCIIKTSAGRNSRIETIKLKVQ